MQNKQRLIKQALFAMILILLGSAESKASEGAIGAKIRVVEQRIYITEVSKNSPAQNAGLQRGDILINVNGHPVTKLFEFVQLIKSNPGATYNISFLRDGIIQNASIRIGKKEGTNENVRIINFEGYWHCQIDDDAQTAHIYGPKISNRAAKGVSGTIKLSVYLMDYPYDEESLLGYEIASTTLGEIPAQTSIYNIDENLIFNAIPPSNTYYLTIVISEYQRNHFVVQDHIDISENFAFTNRTVEKILQKAAGDLQAVSANTLKNFQSPKNEAEVPEIDEDASTEKNNSILQQSAKRHIAIIKKHEKNQEEMYEKLYREEINEAEYYRRQYELNKNQSDLEKAKSHEARAKDYLEKAEIWAQK